jgi:hypothetical protein
MQHAHWTHTLLAHFILKLIINNTLSDTYIYDIHIHMYFIFQIKFNRAFNKITVYRFNFTLKMIF